MEALPDARSSRSAPLLGIPSVLDPHPESP